MTQTKIHLSFNTAAEVDQAIEKWRGQFVGEGSNTQSDRYHHLDAAASAVYGKILGIAQITIDREARQVKRTPWVAALHDVAQEMGTHGYDARAVTWLRVASRYADETQKSHIGRDWMAAMDRLRAMDLGVALETVIRTASDCTFPPNDPALESRAVHWMTHTLDGIISGGDQDRLWTATSTLGQYRGIGPAPMIGTNVKGIHSKSMKELVAQKYAAITAARDADKTVARESDAGSAPGAHM